MDGPAMFPEFQDVPSHTNHYSENAGVPSLLIAEHDAFPKL